MADLFFQILRIYGVSLPRGDVCGGDEVVPEKVSEARCKDDRLCCWSLPFRPNSRWSALRPWLVPDVRGALPPGGFLGDAGDSMRAALEPDRGQPGRCCDGPHGIVSDHEFFVPHNLGMDEEADGGRGRIGILARVRAWREERESARLRKRVEEIKIAGRPPVVQQRVSTKKWPRKTSQESARLTRLMASGPTTSRGPTVIKFHEPEMGAPKGVGRTEDRAIIRRRSGCPRLRLLRTAERGEKMEEAELKEYARAIEQKCAEFDVGGHITQINPGPVVTTFEFKPEAGIKYSRITGLGEDLCLALRAESILIERIPGKSTVGIEVPNPHRETIALRDIVESPEFGHSASN